MAVVGAIEPTRITAAVIAAVAAAVTATVVTTTVKPVHNGHHYRQVVIVESFVLGILINRKSFMPFISDHYNTGYCYGQVDDH